MGCLNEPQHGSVLDSSGHVPQSRPDNRNYLKIKLPSKGLSADFYIKTVRSVMEGGKSLTDISYQAWLAANSDEKPGPGPELPADNDYWLVGAYWDDRDPTDQTSRFLEEGVWQNGYPDRYLDVVKSMKVGDRIGIKAASTQKKNLPFDARGNTVSRMEIKAIGTIVSNRGDGQTVEVEWDAQFKPRDWYFFTYQATIWRSSPRRRLREQGDWLRSSSISSGGACRRTTSGSARSGGIRPRRRLNLRR